MQQMLLLLFVLGTGRARHALRCLPPAECPAEQRATPHRGLPACPSHGGQVVCLPSLPCLPPSLCRQVFGTRPAHFKLFGSASSACPDQSRVRCVEPAPAPAPAPACPAVTQRAAGECAGRVSDCWSLGRPDTDCSGHALCCSDGCANLCQGAGPVRVERPSLAQVPQSTPLQADPVIADSELTDVALSAKAASAGHVQPPASNSVYTKPVKGKGGNSDKTLDTKDLRKLLIYVTEELRKFIENDEVLRKQ